MSHIPLSAKLGSNTVIENDVSIGENVVIGHNTVILQGTKIGDNVTIGCNCVLGIKPSINKRMRKISNSTRQLVIEANTRIGHVVSIYSGTQIGKHVFIGDHASIRENVTIEEGSVVGRAAIVELNSKIGKFCTIQTLAYVTGDTILEDNVFIGPCVSMSNDKYMGAEEYSLKGPHIKKGAKIGNNASLLPAVIIGVNTIVGAGSVVTKNIGDNVVVAGVPAKELTSS
ncbi:acyltransferase [Aquibacillus rhizosphaerae]|uniref:DapH/DapD/GlmU-related protein n=1 Tax=Aquibacillus rhizosphaerae TaxID=3051431 RepID=A0ABT7L1P0_9BACI|nr:N-acetyltransferase [Aquibacillus sp. LR5S19]MDL4839760.1 DapH/DapD/GlmU-related protein [Aquibacillus sp. LR5S19]